MQYFNFDMTDLEMRDKYGKFSKELHPDKTKDNQVLGEIYSNMKLEYEDLKVIKSRWTELTEYFSKRQMNNNPQNLQSNILNKLMNMMDDKDFLPNATKLIEVMFGNKKE